MNNPYGYYELDYENTQQGIMEMEHINYLLKSWEEKDRRKSIARKMQLKEQIRMQKIIRLLWAGRKE